MSYTVRILSLLSICITGCLAAVSPQQEREQDRLFNAVLNRNVAYIQYYIHTHPHAPNPAIEMRPHMYFFETPHNTILHVASELGVDEIVDLLIFHRVNVNVTNAQGKTPLHKALTHGQPSVAHKLLKAGANANIRDIAGYTPLERAYHCAINPAATMRKNINPQYVWQAIAILLGMPLEHFHTHLRDEYERNHLRNLVGTTINYLREMYYTI